MNSGKAMMTLPIKHNQDNTTKTIAIVLLVIGSPKDSGAVAAQTNHRVLCYRPIPGGLINFPSLARPLRLCQGSLAVQSATHEFS
jgi:hypothetical protein